MPKHVKVFENFDRDEVTINLPKIDHRMDFPDEFIAKIHKFWEFSDLGLINQSFSLVDPPESPRWSFIKYSSGDWVAVVFDGKGNILQRNDSSRHYRVYAISTEK